RRRHGAQLSLPADAGQHRPRRGRRPRNGGGARRHDERRLHPLRRRARALGNGGRRGAAGARPGQRREGGGGAASQGPPRRAPVARAAPFAGALDRTRRRPIVIVKLTIPNLSLVLLVGPSGCGKSTFARRHFRPTEVLSSDYFRGLVADDETNQACSRDAFELLHTAVAKRLAWKRLTVVDATNLQPEARKPLLELARRYHYLTTAIVFDLPEEVCRANNLRRPDRTVPDRVIATQLQLLRRSLGPPEKEGFRNIHVLRSPEQVNSAVVERQPLRLDRRQDHGPFDIVGDVHGCLDELGELLEKLGYQVGHQPDANGIPDVVVRAPQGRRAI